MKKAIVAIVLTFMILGACSNSNTKDQKIVVGNVVTTTTTRWSDPAGDAVKAACKSDAVTLGTDWKTFATTIQEAVGSGLSNNSSVVAAAIAAANRGMVKTRSWISDCGSYFPDVAANLKGIMDSLEATIGTLS